VPCLKFIREKIKFRFISLLFKGLQNQIFTFCPFSEALPLKKRQFFNRQPLPHYYIACGKAPQHLNVSLTAHTASAHKAVVRHSFRKNQFK
jgi:hypothetical protein